MAMKFIAVFLSVLAVASADDKAKCIVNVVDATNEIMDAGIEAWAASDRCSTLPDTTVHCVVDISAVVTSVTRMVEYVLKAVNNCDPLKTTNFKCAAAGMKLTTGLTALTSATARMTSQCPNRGASITDPSAHDHFAHDRVSMGVCVLSIKDGIKNLAKAAAVFTKHKSLCGPNSPAWECADMSLTVAKHLVSLGKYIMNAASHCAHSHLYHKGTHCGVAVTAVVAALTELGSGGAAIAGHCVAPAPVPPPTIPVPTPVPAPAPTIPVPTPVPAPAPRLYSENVSAKAPTSMVSPLNAVLLALLPVAAVGSFFMGAKFQERGRRLTRVVQPVE